jgi:O-acetyl-ADP-ribose deacetylase (regulator of RNase III)
VDAEWNGCRVTLLRGDITQQRVDAIVNAANSGLAGGGGVDGAIHRAGGPSILAECRTIIGRVQALPPGEAVATTAGNLPAKRVIHAVGPIYHSTARDPRAPGPPELLASAYRRSLELAVAAGLSSIAFPSISTGAYGYPVREAARVALRTVRAFLEERGAPKTVVFCLFSEGDLESYRQALQETVAAA